MYKIATFIISIGLSISSAFALNNIASLLQQQAQQCNPCNNVPNTEMGTYNITNQASIFAGDGWQYDVPTQGGPILQKRGPTGPRGKQGNPG